MNSSEDQGAYEKKQLHCKDRLIAWSHRSRFELACSMVKKYAGGNILDYGCGDGTFLKQIASQFKQAVGVDVDAQQLEECRRRFPGVTNLEFHGVSEAFLNANRASIDVVMCMEVLEHCLEPQVEKVLTDIRTLMKPSGAAIFSVPVEVGASLLVKQTLRRLAALRNLGDYRYMEHYSISELMTMFLAGKESQIVRPVYNVQTPAGSTISYHGHKGFNWKRFQNLLNEKFEVVKTRFSPIGLFNGALSSQVWFECRLK